MYKVVGRLGLFYALMDDTEVYQALSKSVDGAIPVPFFFHNYNTDDKSFNTLVKFVYIK